MSWTTESQLLSLSVPTGFESVFYILGGAGNPYGDFTILGVIVSDDM